MQFHKTKAQLTRKFLGSAAAGLAVVALLAGCAETASEEEPIETTPTEEVTEDIDETNDDDEESDDDAGGDQPTPVSGDVLQPGDTVQGEAASLPWISFEDAESVFAHRVTAIEPAPEADVAQIAERQPTITDYDLYYITVESHYVSGDVTPYAAFYTNFDPARADGTKLQSVSLIGFDSCPSESVKDPGTDPSQVIVNCVVAAVAKGSEAPAGVLWAASGTPYASYNGDPAVILM